MEIQVSKIEFKAKALEYFRQVESSGNAVVVTDHGKPTLEVRPYRSKDRKPLDVLRGSVIQYVNPTEPVDENDWDAAQ
jgi:antitoxin (DNA-binding transcriptional repressor) of toxin-antitoxin stability system